MNASTSLLCAFLISSAALAADLPSAAEYQANWPRFRGPDGGGFLAQAKAPLSCADHIAWSVDVPADGYGSPVVWGERVFLSGGNADQCVVMCFDTKTGKLLWQTPVPKAPVSSEEPDQSGMAAATVATDGLRVYALFANGDLVACDFAGAVLWTKHFTAPMNGYGHATSLATYQDRVIVQLDQGEAEDKLSKISSFDGATGAVVWEQPRAVGASWATPILFDAAGKTQIVTLAVPWVISYAATDGAEIWRAECLDGEVTPSPVYAGGTLLVVSPSNKLQAIRPDGQGDVTQTHLDWIAEDGIPDVTSPVSNGDLVFVIDTGGTLTCYDAKTGRKQWEHDTEEECKASPSLIGDKLYLITAKGTLIVAAAARDYQELARSDLGEQVYASPAFAHGEIFVRSLKRLFCIGGEGGR